MVSVINCNMEGFRQRSEGMDIFCLGGGKYFRDFICKNPGVHISGVIDNYYQGDKVVTENGEYPLYSVKGFCDIYNQECVLVVAVKAFEDVIDQLDDIKELDGIPCFLSMALNGYCGIEDGQKSIFKKQIEALSKRGYVTGQGLHVAKKREKHYQIWEYYEKSNVGGSKARTDICKVLSDCGYAVRKVHCTGANPDGLLRRQMEHDWGRIFEGIEEGSTLFIQHPAPVETELPEGLLLKMKHERGVRFIVLVHEVESLRKKYNSYHRQKEFEAILSIGDVFIVHNDMMRRFYIDMGIDGGRVVSLGIFDYLDSQPNVKKIFEKSVTIAANLNLDKSPYLLQLKALKTLKVHLYGPNYAEDICKGAANIHYHGSLPTEAILLKLDRGFGLVWDGESIETCSGGTGEYLRYNNPHKLSLYLSAGLPVIIWSGAAQAQFVKKNRVGFCVDSLYEIHDILEKHGREQYDFYIRNIDVISQRLKKGDYMKTALEKAEERLAVTG